MYAQNYTMIAFKLRLEEGHHYLQKKINDGKFCVSDRCSPEQRLTKEKLTYTETFKSPFKVGLTSQRPANSSKINYFPACIHKYDKKLHI